MSKSLFNADAYLQAIETPTIQMHGVNYPTTPMSFKDAVTFKVELQNLDEADEAATCELIGRICTAVGLPADKVLAFPMSIVSEMVGALFLSQRQPQSEPWPAPKTHGKLRRKN